MSSAADPAPEERPKITRKEILLFCIFGMIPILLIYAFASVARDDARGEAFEQERRLLIDACMQQLDDREQCRTLIDEPLIACYQERARDDGTVEDRLGLRRCITQRDDDKFRPE